MEGTMSIRLIELLALDANGTIFNDTPQFIRAANGIFAHFGKPELDSQILRDRWTQPWTKIYREAGILEADVTDDDLYTLYNKLYKEALSMRQPKPFSGLRMVLAQLKRWGVKLVVVSGQQNKVTIPL
jgi:phosphoglycolate phosphatase-like HAD superfamily hydrolase